MIDRRVLEITSLVLGVLGSLYLSYDLLGKPGGVLRRLIPGISYGVFLAAASWLQVGLLVASGLGSDGLGASEIGLRISQLAELEHTYPFVPFLYGALLGAFAPSLYPNVDRKELDTSPRRYLWWAVPIVAFLGILAYLGVSEYLSTGNLLIATVIPASIGILLVLFIVFPLVLVPRISLIAETLPPQRLGAIGAVCTLLAFATQLAVQLSLQT